MLARKFGFKIKEVPVHWINEIHSKVGAAGLGGYGSTLLEVFKIRWWMITGKYKIKK
jgi:hypothetical protein